MPIVGAAIIPNSPLLLPKLSVTAQKHVIKTKEAIYRLGHELYALQPSLVIIIGKSESNLPVCSLLQAPKLSYSFAEWGDMVTAGEALIATGFTHSLKERAETSFPIILKSDTKLPTNLAVTVALLLPYLEKIPYVFLQLPKNISVDNLTKLSSILTEQCNISAERIVLLSVGTLGQKREKENNESLVFDKYLQSAIVPMNINSLINIDPSLRQRVKESVWLPTTLLGLVISERVLDTQILSYESPSQVGYLVALFNLK